MTHVAFGLVGLVHYAECGTIMPLVCVGLPVVATLGYIALAAFRGWDAHDVRYQVPREVHHPGVDRALYGRCPLSFFLEHVASCPVCGCLVFGSPTVLDPSFVGRRFIRSVLPAGTIERQGFGPGRLVCASPHECPPESECRLPGPEQRRRMTREAAQDRPGRTDSPSDGCGTDEPLRRPGGPEVRP